MVTPSFFRKLSDDFKALPLDVKLIILTLFLRTFGWGFVDPFFSIFISGFSKNYAGVGSLVSIINITCLLAIIPLMKLADKLKDSVIIRDGEAIYFLATIFYLLAAFTGFRSFLILGFIFNGIGIPFIVIGAETYIRKRTSLINPSGSFAFYTAFNYLGWILGMFMGSFTFKYYGFKWMFLFILPGTLAGFFILSRIHEAGIHSFLSGLKKYFHSGHDLKMIARDLKHLNKKTIFPLILSFFDGIIVMFSYVFVPLLARSMNLEFGQIAFLMALMYSPFIFSFLISELASHFKRSHVIAAGLFVGGISFFFLAFIAHQTWLSVILILQSFSLAIIRPAYNGIITNLTPRKNLGEVTGLNNMVQRFGIVIGPLLSGFIADRYGVHVTFLMIAILAFLLAAVTLSFRGYETLKTNP